MSLADIQSPPVRRPPVPDVTTRRDVLLRLARGPTPCPVTDAWTGVNLVQAAALIAAALYTDPADLEAVALQVGAETQLALIRHRPFGHRAGRIVAFVVAGAGALELNLALSAVAAHYRGGFPAPDDAAGDAAGDAAAPGGDVA